MSLTIFKSEEMEQYTRDLAKTEKLEKGGMRYWAFRDLTQEECDAECAAREAKIASLQAIDVSQQIAKEQAEIDKIDALKA